MTRTAVARGARAHIVGSAPGPGRPRSWILLGATCLATASTGCCVFARSAPASQIPDARAAIARMRDTHACSRGVGGEAKIDYFGDEGRVRGKLLFLTERPEQLRFDVYSPFGVIISTLSSDGQNFALYNLPEKQYLHGPASTCNVARFTGVPVPPHALVSLMGGEAPVLVHEPTGATLGWGCGAYQLDIQSKHQATQSIRLVPYDADWDKPWQEQRLKVLEVSVEQQGYVLYRADLRDHGVASTAKPSQPPDGMGPAAPPSGPECSAEVPRAVRLEVPAGDKDLILSYEDVHHNPPLAGGAFTQPVPGGVSVQRVSCE